MKKIEDYLHLYLGCELDTSIHGGYIHPYGCVKITKLDISTIHDVLWSLAKKERDIKGGFSDSDHIYCKPLLRPLASMTDEEALEVGNLSFVTSTGRPFHSDKWKLHLHVFANTANHVTIVLEEKPMFNIDGLWSQSPTIRTSNDGFQSVPLITHVIIHTDFRIERHTPFELNNWKGERPQQYIFKYLLSKGFDLFNLIPEGLAIDSTLTPSLK